MADARVSAYFKDPKTGEISEVLLFPIDANHAAGQFPDQWSLSPWDVSAPDAGTPIADVPAAGKGSAKG